jgi:hypothetical protein
MNVLIALVDKPVGEGNSILTTFSSYAGVLKKPQKQQMLCDKTKR